MYDLRDKRILVTGATGFLGSHIIDSLLKRGCRAVFGIVHSDYDLTSQVEVGAMFRAFAPEVVIQMAGLVGGIGANQDRPADFLYTNLMIDTLMMRYSWESGVSRFAAAAAGCGYPQDAPMPLKEDDFWNGYPQKWSAPYSLAKRMLNIHSRAMFEQYGMRSVIIIPGNIYGPNDQFRLNDAHVIPALVRKFVDAVEDGRDEVVVWGTGRATRDFVFAGDVAECLLRAIETYDTPRLINASSGVESSIADVVSILAELTGFGGRITWDDSKPDGQPRRCFDISRACRDLGYEPTVDLRTGLRLTVEWYKENRLKPTTRR